jgi:hypothetical protein
MLRRGSPVFKLRRRDLNALTCDNLFLALIDGFFVALLDWIDVLLVVLGGWCYFKARLDELGIPGV